MNIYNLWNSAMLTTLGFSNLVILDMNTVDSGTTLVWSAVVVQSLSRVCDPVDRSTPGFPVPVSRSLLKLMCIESVMPSNHLIPCRPFLLLPSIFPSIRVFSNELTLPIRWPKYWSFSFSISPSNEYSGLISFRIDFLAVQGTLRSLSAPQFESITSLALSPLYGPALISIHDYWKHHSFDYMDICWQNAF